MKTYFITGISTEVGKTIAAAIVTEALEADYWKPVQAGELDHDDKLKVKQLLTNTRSVIHPNTYALNTPMSPHAAAAIDGQQILLNKIKPPITDNHLVIEGAGGLLVPLNQKNTVMDLIRPEYKVIVVSRHYLGSINHTLLTIDQLKSKGFQPAILFSGDEHPTTESIISKMSRAPVIGRIDQEPFFDSNVVLEYARKFKTQLQRL